MAAATARIVGATARSMGEMSMPAMLNMPPFAPKSFCMSITSTAHLPRSIRIDSGFASMVTRPPWWPTDAPF